MAVKRVTIDPRLRLPYHTYVLRGLADAGYRVRFRRLDAPAHDGMAMLAGRRRIWVDTNDMAEVDEDAYEWCDVFGKVNCVAHDLATHPKIRLLGPLFGIRRWPTPRAYAVAAHLVATGGHPRKVLQGVRFQALTRLPISAYEPAASQSGYVFHRSRAWEGKHGGTNAPRERFIAALESLHLDSTTALSGDRIPLAEYLTHTKRSSCAFNCPAVHACLGWKLGEYLALGKAIISTPLGRELPAPLVHGEHLHFVRDDVDSMRDAIALVDSDQAYRKQLEYGARAWYEQHMSPLLVVARLLEN